MTCKCCEEKWAPPLNEIEKERQQDAALQAFVDKLSKANEMKEEVARLRAALERILKEVGTSTLAHKIAREALK